MTDGGDRDDARGTPRDGRGATIPEGDDSAGRSPEGDDDMSSHAEGATAADQLARAELKKRTLEMWLALKDTRVKLDLYGGCAFARVLPVRPRDASRALRPRPPAILSSEPQCTACLKKRRVTERIDFYSSLVVVLLHSSSQRGSIRGVPGRGRHERDVTRERARQRRRRRPGRARAMVRRPVGDDFAATGARERERAMGSGTLARGLTEARDRPTSSRLPVLYCVFVWEARAPR